MVRILKATAQSSIAEAVQHLKRGGLLVFPTETSYGIGCDPENTDAVRGIFRLKGRAGRKPLPLIAGSIAQVRSVAILPKNVLKQVSPFWPGPLSVILMKKAGFRSTALCRKRTMAIRITSHRWTRQLTRSFGAPIIATSANRSGCSPTFSLSAVRRALSRYSPDDTLWVNGGRLPHRPPSTIVEYKRNKMVIHRHGEVNVTAR